MHPDLEGLLDLQAKDRALLDVDLRLQAVLGQVEALDREVEAGQAALEAARRAVADGTTRRDQLQAKIDSYRTLQDRRRQRLEHVGKAREAAALMAELDLARSVMAKEEGEWFRLAEQVTTLEAREAECTRRVEELLAGQAARREDLAQQTRALADERDVALAAREESASRLDRTLRARYDRIRRGRRQAVVVVPMDGGTCGACFTAVPLSRRSQIRTGLLLDGCEACGVILYAADQDG